MFCGNCGAKVNTGSAFCYNCGSRLAEPGQMAQMQQLPPQGQVNNEGWQAQSDNWQAVRELQVTLVNGRNMLIMRSRTEQG